MKKRHSNPKSTHRSPHVSGAVEIESWVFTSGQGPLDPSTRQVVRGTIEEETLLTLQNIEAILQQAGCSRRDVVKCTCHLGNLEDFSGFDATYRAFFESDIPPARTTVASSQLQGIKIEIDAIARKPVL